ncbi:anaphase-promoting complex subunit 2 [Toxorhynchites rutilus septentrionalis]|uniref:anaphase-promoting complex subunit 2 n=1 Tax=Toxorhynchites rutilus septentrionalis TaxID=329112 RepID=UPI00247A8154|nr:anaphase-promoting complex subunit 2 [Toxorhynchites rutilus septentrionalis]
MLNENICISLYRVFPILENKLVNLPVPDHEIIQLSIQLEQAQAIPVIYETIFFKIERLLRHETVPKFWRNFNHSPSMGEPQAQGSRRDTNRHFFRFQQAVHELHEDFVGYYLQLKRLEKLKRGIALPIDVAKKPNDLGEFHRMFRCLLLSQLPAHFNDLVYEFYNTAFKVFALSHAETEDCMDIPETYQCTACGAESAHCQCQSLANAFASTNRYLTSMGLLDKIAGFTLTTLIQERIDARIVDTKESFSVSYVETLERWLNTVVLQWLTRIYNRGSLTVSPTNKKIEEAINNFQTKLSFYMYENYANAIIDQFFSIIIDFPMSLASIDDLKLCLEKIDLRSHLIKTVKQTLETKLLHPGVDTPDILTGYVAAIKTLRHLDPSGVFLQTITEPVKEYLRSRPDTVRCVVTSLTEEGCSDLSDELAKSENVKVKDNVNEKLELTDWENWNPDPVNVDVVATKDARPGKPSDIISMVVDIYGSKELFVNEYRNLLAERLLSQLDTNPGKEIRNLELLKLRFGETMLHSCEVMLKDMNDSKKINSHILFSEFGFQQEKPFDISALIVSSQFWPTFKKETMELPPVIKEMFDRYTKAFERFKDNRTLHWTPLNGKVTIEIELDGKTTEMQVTPAQATIAILFGEQREWELEKLAQKMNMPPSILRKRLIFWQSQGLIREVREYYYILNDRASRSEVADEIQTQAPDVCEDDEAESAMESASDQREEELQVFWSYIEAMLTNLDSLPLDRIHQMLKMFAPQVDFSQEELKNILQRKVREHKLVYAGGVYQLPKV